MTFGDALFVSLRLWMSLQGKDIVLVTSDRRQLQEERLILAQGSEGPE